MAYVYKITNKVNGKIYIGQTSRSIEERFFEHKRDAFRETNSKRPLYSAIRKYGIDAFSIELIEETENPLEREKYWIEYFGSFKNGYNATVGGEGGSYIDYKLVVAEYLQLKNQREVARKLNISPCSVNKILKIYGVEKLTCEEVAQKTLGKIVNQYDLQGKFIKSFPSTKIAAESLGKVTKTSNGATSHISDVCKGKRKTAYGFKWKFAKDDIKN